MKIAIFINYNVFQSGKRPRGYFKVFNRGNHTFVGEKNILDTLFFRAEYFYISYNMNGIFKVIICFF